MNLDAKVVQVEIAKQVFWENGGETNGHETSSIGGKPIISAALYFYHIHGPFCQEKLQS